MASKQSGMRLGKAAKKLRDESETKNKRIDALRDAVYASGAPFSIRLSDEFFEHVDAIVARINEEPTPPGTVDRTKVMRGALFVGMNAFESLLTKEVKPRKKRRRSSKQSQRRKARRGKT